jgi:hypothetical protein
MHSVHWVRALELGLSFFFAYRSEGNGMHDDVAKFSHDPLCILNGIRVGVLGQNVVSWMMRLIPHYASVRVVDFHNEMRRTTNRATRFCGAVYAFLQVPSLQL